MSLLTSSLDELKRLKLPPIQSAGGRLEAEAFVLGFALCLKAISKFVTAEAQLDSALFQYVKELADELYPPHPEPPPGVKKPKPEQENG